MKGSVLVAKSADLAEVEHFISVLQYVKREREKLNDLEKEARSVVEEALGDAEVGKVGDRKVVTWKYRSRTALVQKKLKENFPSVYDACVEEQQVRYFELTPEES